MGIRIFWLTLIRILLVIFSAATLACHIAQMVILDNREWWPKNYAYILYFVGAGVSTLSSLGLLLLTLTTRSVHGDRYLGPINFALMVATVVIGTLKSGPVPWLPPSSTSTSRPDTIGFQSSCSSYRTNMGLYQRCWLSNGMWLGSIVLAAFWLILILYVFIQRSSDIYHRDDEYEVYDFKNGSTSPGIAVTSPISLNTPPPQHQTAFDPHATYYDPGYSNNNNNNTNNVDYGYSHHQQQQPYDAYGVGTNHGYYMPSLAGPSSSTPTESSSHIYYPSHDETTHIISHPLPSPPPPPKSSQVPHTYD